MQTLFFQREVSAFVAEAEIVWSFSFTLTNYANVFACGCRKVQKTMHYMVARYYSALGTPRHFSSPMTQVWGDREHTQPLPTFPGER